MRQPWALAGGLDTIQIFVAPIGALLFSRYSVITPRWGYYVLGFAIPRLSPGVIDILPRRGKFLFFRNLTIAALIGLTPNFCLLTPDFRLLFRSLIGIAFKISLPEFVLPFPVFFLKRRIGVLP